MPELITCWQYIYTIFTRFCCNFRSMMDMSSATTPRTPLAKTCSNSANQQPCNSANTPQSTSTGRLTEARTGDRANSTVNARAELAQQLAQNLSLGDEQVGDVVLPDMTLKPRRIPSASPSDHIPEAKRTKTPSSNLQSSRIVGKHNTSETARTPHESPLRSPRDGSRWWLAAPNNAHDARTPTVASRQSRLVEQQISSGHSRQSIDYNDSFLSRSPSARTQRRSSRNESTRLPGPSRTAATSNAESQSGNVSQQSGQVAAARTSRFDQTVDSDNQAGAISPNHVLAQSTPIQQNRSSARLESLRSRSRSRIDSDHTHAARPRDATQPAQLPAIQPRRRIVPRRRRDRVAQTPAAAPVRRRHNVRRENEQLLNELLKILIAIYKPRVAENDLDSYTDVSSSESD